MAKKGWKGQQGIADSQSHFDPWENFETISLGRYFFAYKGIKVFGIS